MERLLGEGDTFTEISVERMVAEAGIARSTFYVYFEDKGDLLEAWFGEITAELRDAAAEWWRLGPTPAYPDLRAALAAIVSTYRPHTTLMAAMYDTAAYDAGVRDLVTAMMDENVAGLRKHIRTGQRDGFVDPSLPAGETAQWLTWMAERGLHQLVRTANDAELERAARRLRRHRLEHVVRPRAGLIACPGRTAGRHPSCPDTVYDQPGTAGGVANARTDDGWTVAG